MSPGADRGLGVESDDQHRGQDDSERETRSLRKVRRSSRDPDQQRTGKGHDQETDREAGDEAEAHQKARRGPDHEPEPAALTGQVPPPPAQDTGG